MTQVYDTIAGVLGVVGPLLVIAVSAQAGEPLLLAVVLWSLAVLLGGLGLYSAWALLGGKM